MQTEEKGYGSLVIAIVSILVSAAAWIWPSAPMELRIAVSILAVVLVLFSQRSRYEGFKAWFLALLAFMIVNYPLLLAAVLSGAFILLAPIQPQSDLVLRAQLVMTAILAASLGSLVLKYGRQPAVRVVKGSGDEAFLIEDGIKRHIPDSLTHEFVMLDVYRQTERISDLELRLHPTGKLLPRVSECRLVKGLGPAVYVVWEGRRKHIPDGPTFEYFFNGRTVEELSDTDLERIPRTGALRTILAGTGSGPSIVIYGGINVTQNPQEQ